MMNEEYNTDLSSVYAIIKTIFNFPSKNKTRNLNSNCLQLQNFSCNTLFCNKVITSYISKIYGEAEKVTTKSKI